MDGSEGNKMAIHNQVIPTTAGLHHVTAIASEPQANIEFCTKVGVPKPSSIRSAELQCKQR
jgi:hypothetical protein